MYKVYIQAIEDSIAMRGGRPFSSLLGVFEIISQRLLGRMTRLLSFLLGQRFLIKPQLRLGVRDLVKGALQIHLTPPPIGNTRLSKKRRF